MHARLSDGRAHLIHWVAAVPNLDGHPWSIPLQRGPNRWRLTVAADGSLPSGGLVPSLIAWETPSPAEILPASGISLHELYLHTPEPEALQGWGGRHGGIDIAVRGADHTFLRATLGTPAGLLTLE